MIRQVLLSLIAAGVLFSGTGPAAAQPPAESIVQAEILPGWETERGTHMAGLRLILAPGWKTYWRAPGDAGIPPRFDWSGSSNMQAVATYWPRPEVFERNGMRAIGYVREVVLPLELTPERAGAPILLRGVMELGVCHDVCMPMVLELRADLPATANPAPIRAALAARPQSATEAGVGRVTCTVEPIADGLRLTAEIPVAPMGGEEVAVVELRDPAIWVSEPQLTRQGNRLIAVAELVPEAAAPFALDRSSVRITLLAGPRAVDIRGCEGR
ncbi:protein-disulfide reductase DsbD domain-containing protein [Actibacterium sp. MT2.3-13A]|uniref:protein-disulfide reductase DsbD domain-containing protein n=1 Tax=Actibacterium sp. MT2.3-13A TaxID=2828332 RepID=UPI001BA906F9|nr:protein-disulfide reductase DsbD domain-containing protein [Actibacterium sp. MT2.3-13A]